MLVNSKRYSLHEKSSLKLDVFTNSLMITRSLVISFLPKTSKTFFSPQDGDKSVYHCRICVTKSGRSLGSDKLISPVALDRKKKEKPLRILTNLYLHAYDCYLGVMPIT